MTSGSSRLALGLTGSFGSGSSTLAAALENRGFGTIPLSQPLKEMWSSENKRPPEDASRGDLQDLGNMLAGSKGTDYLADMAWRTARKSGFRRVVFDGIKREGEIDFLRDKYPDFCLVAVQCGREERWRRVKGRYEKQGLTERDFNTHDMRDQIEEVPHGQQVSLCVDDADVVVNNPSHSSKAVAVKNLGGRIERYLGLLTKEGLCAPSHEEIFMSMAYAQAERSGCIKRHVGAVIVDEHGWVVSAGFNENPADMKACYEVFGHCRKDALVSEHLEALAGKHCAECGNTLQDVSPPWRCQSCGLSLKEHYFSDHGVRWCQAVHGEERAIARANGRPLSGTTLYTTTFPCLNCAKLIVDARLARLVYVEPYPETESIDFLSGSGIEMSVFEGVKVRAFHRLFKPYRAYTEEKYKL